MTGDGVGGLGDVVAVTCGLVLVDSLADCATVGAGGVVGDGVIDGVGDGAVVSEAALSITLVAGTTVGEIAEEIVG
jgi:hypothetical protein